MGGKAPAAITNITLNRATFTDTSIDGLTFVNLFYGSNGVGKSSVARAIEEGDGVVWADGCSAEDFDVLVYNQDYIDRSLASYGRLQGVFIFGEEDIEAKRRIQLLTEERKEKSDERAAALEEYKRKSAEIDSALTDFQNTCFSKTADIRKRFEKAMDGRKQKRSFADAILSEASPLEHDMAGLERLYDVAFDDTARTYPEFRKVGAAPTYGRLPGRELLDKVIVSSSDTPFARFMKALGTAASDWVREGHTHYSAAAAGRCPYCQQKLPAQFEGDIAACFDAQYQQDIRDLRQFANAYERETMETVRVLKANIGGTMASIDIKPYQDRLALLESSFEVNRHRIAEKVKEPTMAVSLEDTDSLLLELGAMIDEINRLISANNAVVTEKRSSKSRCRLELMQHLAFLLAGDVESYHDETARLKKEADDIAARGQQLQRDISALGAELSGLNKRNVNTAAAVEGINGLLRDSGFQGFRLRAREDDENVYQVIRDDGSVAQGLSDGERNFIAFLYFYHQVLGSRSSEELREKIVVIDDPVSGMDSSAMFLVGAIVREMADACTGAGPAGPKAQGGGIRQLFLLTHNVQFYREVAYRQAGCYSRTSLYLIRKSRNLSAIRLCKRRSKEAPEQEENYIPVQSSYGALWDELRDVQAAIPALNVMRRILEYYFLQLCGYEGSDLREAVLESEDGRGRLINAAGGQQPDMADYRLASSMLAYISGPDAGEGLGYIEEHDDVEACRRVFRLIFEAMGHGRHYKMMTGKA